LLELLARGSAKVELGQRSAIIEGGKGDANAKELVDFVNMTDTEIEKMDPDKRIALLERLNKYSK